MRRHSVTKCGRASSLKNKYYINDNSLTVTGEKIKLLKLPYDQKGDFVVRKARSESQTPDEDKYQLQRTTFSVKTNVKSNRKAYNLSVNCYKNKEICNQKLKDIYESIEIEQFRRLLGQINPGAKPTRASEKSKAINSINADKIYEEFFQKHYDFLEQIAHKYKK